MSSKSSGNFFFVNAGLDFFLEIEGGSLARIFDTRSVGSFMIFSFFFRIVGLLDVFLVSGLDLDFCTTPNANRLLI